MKLVISTFTMLALLGTSGCATRQQVKTKRYQKQVNRLAKQLRKQKRLSSELRDENLVLRQLAGVPEPCYPPS